MPRTLIILTPAFPADDTDTTWLPFLQNFVKALACYHPELTPLIVSFRYPAAGTYTWHGARVVALGKKRRIAAMFAAWRTLRQLRRSEAIAGMLSFWHGECAFVGERFARRHGLRHYCWMPGQDARGGNRFVALNRMPPHRLIAFSDAQAAIYRDHYGVLPGHVIAPGIDTAAFGAPAATRDIDLLGAGSLIPLKNYSAFVDIVAALKSRFPRISAVICGNGPEEAALREKIDRLGLSENVSLYGSIPHQEVLQLMSRARVFLHTSTYEGFGLVLAEALYAGDHVVSLVKPMHHMPASHHQAANYSDMLRIVRDLLADATLSHPRELLFSAGGTAGAIARLFSGET